MCVYMHRLLSSLVVEVLLLLRVDGGGQDLGGNPLTPLCISLYLAVSRCISLSLSLSLSPSPIIYKHIIYIYIYIYIHTHTHPTINLYGGDDYPPHERPPDEGHLLGAGWGGGYY